MITPPDPFVQRFDSIEIDPARAPSPAAIESAFAAIAPADPLLAVSAAAPDDGRPGFFLLDDAEGRFIVDREMGVVTVRDETLLTREHGAVHPVRLRVVEPSGASYDLDLRLRLTGRVPQVLGAEDFGFGGEAPDVAAPAIETPAPAPCGPAVAWTAFAVVRGLQSKPELIALGAFGAILAPTLPPTNERIAIVLADTVPAPTPAHAAWPH